MSPILKWLTLSLLAYVAVAFIVKMPWGAGGRAPGVPEARRSAPTISTDGRRRARHHHQPLSLLLAGLAGGRGDATRARRDKPLRDAPDQARRRARAHQDRHLRRHGLLQLRRLLHHADHGGDAARARRHQTSDSATQAAEALRPIAGEFAFVLFALGIIGTGLLAMPVLAGSAAYAVAETFGWHAAWRRKPDEARGFYAIIAVATLIGVGLDFTGIDPIKALFWSAVINGVVAVPIMAMMMLIVSSRADHGPLQGPLTAGRAGLARHRDHGAGRPRSARLVRDRLTRPATATPRPATPRSAAPRSATRRRREGREHGRHADEPYYGVTGLTVGDVFGPGRSGSTSDFGAVGSTLAPAACAASPVVAYIAT